MIIDVAYGYCTLRDSARLDAHAPFVEEGARLIAGDGVITVQCEAFDGPVSIGFGERDPDPDLLDLEAWDRVDESEIDLGGQLVVRTWDLGPPDEDIAVAWADPESVPGGFVSTAGRSDSTKNPLLT